MPPSRSKRRGTTRASGNGTTDNTIPATSGHKRHVEDGETLNPISCELCRQRKCKCDRKLPFCSQCASDPSKCVYPEIGKRGLPPGYLNQLEQRLAETETALYVALMTLSSASASGQPVPVSHQVLARSSAVPSQKSARMEEWSRLPLGEWGNLQRWFTAVSDRFTVTTDQSAPSLVDSVDHQHPGTQSGSMRFPAHGPSPLYDDAYDGGDIGTSDNGLPHADTAVNTNRAEKLSNNDPGIYF